MSEKWRGNAWRIALGAGLLLAFWVSLPTKAAWPKLVVPAVGSVPADGHWTQDFASQGDTKFVHAASVVELADGRLRAFWFAGSREGAADVNIDSSVFDPASGRWSPEVASVTRSWIEQQWGRHVRKLGNMVPVLDADGSLRLFLVTVTFGGWAASRVVVLTSHDGGASWVFDGELKTSPFLNISTLVKTPPVRYADGTIGLPVYREFIAKFGELLRLDADNRILGSARIGSGRTAIQPLLLVTGADTMQAFLRPSDTQDNKYVYLSHSVDRGAHWAPIHLSDLENPGSALGGLALSPTHWLLVANCNRLDRDDLCVRETQDAGAHWVKRWMLQDARQWQGKHIDRETFGSLLQSDLPDDARGGRAQLLKNAQSNRCNASQGCRFIFDYPYMIRTRNGDLHVVYTWNKTLIGHAWLRVGQTEKASGG